MPTLERDGARIHYEISGSGPAVVLGHSFLCDTHMWAAVAPALAERYRVINVDFRGHGGSTAPSPHTLEDLADDWRATLDREGIARAALVGLSMGGMTAMRLALSTPDRVAGLGLLDTSADPEPPTKRVQYRFMAGLERRFGHIAIIDAIVPRIMMSATTRRTRRDLYDREAARLKKVDVNALYWTSRAVFDRVSIVSRLAEIRCPTLVMVGAEDVATTPAKSRRLAAGIRGARLVELPGAGHLSALETPDAVVRELQAFLPTCAWA